MAWVKLEGLGELLGVLAEVGLGDVGGCSLDSCCESCVFSEGILRGISKSVSCKIELV